MIQGNIILEDFAIVFHQAITKPYTITYTVTDTVTHIQETLTVPEDKFFSALAIAVHSEGMPEYKQDTLSAETIMGKIRWIP